ncbi:DUF2259 domain-containing protein [Leptothermofonsia sichuanensis E412]|uniref:DUF2259 domain-containing protein n=1 Tax=Leptothermofonsia sichuanensis TaxID=2917832 RepID=UPI001CA625BF|nr:DUF2259 domain-containing protein [Leptothermofonsia sichuanensis]QZZ20661.1 DUF2259 domain-containing protein [Leptothermofonsia sichuanensis E412]
MWQIFKAILPSLSPALVLTVLAGCSQPESTSLQSLTSRVVSTSTSSGSIAATTVPEHSAPASSLVATNAHPSLVVSPTFHTSERMAGFSADGSHFMYLESSRDTGAGIPKSTLQVVNIAANHCVQDGCKQTQYGEADAGLEMAVAENSLLQLTWNLRQALQLTPPAPGTKLAIVSRSHTPDGTETVTARLNNSNQVLKLRLRQQQLGSMDQGNIRAAMQLEVNDNGQWRSLDSLNHYREWVLGYSIRELRLSPDGETVVVLVTATKPTFEGTLGTTLVQGFELKPQ